MVPYLLSDGESAVWLVRLHKHVAIMALKAIASPKSNNSPPTPIAV